YRFLASEIDFHGAFAIALVLAKIEFSFLLGIQFENGGKWPAHLATEALQRAYLAVADQLFNFFRFEESAGDDLPEGKIALHTLERFVALVDFPTAFGAWCFEDAKVAGDCVV